MKKILSAFLLLCLAHSASAQDNIIATAGDIKITKQQLQIYLRTLPPEIQNTNDPQAMQQIITVLIQRALLEQQAIKNNIDKNPEVQNRLNLSKQTILADFYLEQLIKENISDEEIQSEYVKYTTANPPAQQAKARHILLASKAEAEEIITQLQQGGDFVELAKTHSTGPSGPNGGDLGYFTRQQMVPEFADASFAMDIGAFSEVPVQTQFGWHVILLEDKRTTEPLPLQDIRPQLEQNLALTKIEKILQDLMQGIEIKYHQLDNVNPQN